ncbi:MAG: sigma-54-dependent Fis family transcriptional regulator [Verrucomicrobiales bacterium]|nr:sigma-54-dependent Fis family transcriptional regulator [Verrucomicrobiales bacterium]
MAARSARLLIANADAPSVDRIVDAFSRDETYLVTCGHPDEALELSRTESFDAVICDAALDPRASFVARLRKARPRLPVIATAAGSDSGIAIEAIKAGAYDFLPQPIDGEELRRVVAEAIAAARRMTTAVVIGDAHTTDAAPGDVLIGRGRAMLEVYKTLGRLTATPVTVLIRGETGTGKELIARALYQHGHRAHQPFVTVNCAAIPEHLLESELFGHEKGAFTGAIASRVGKFEQAHNATLFLDEIGDLDLSLQSKLLRVLQERRIQRVGGREDIPVDVRIIAATHRDLERMVAAGEFREDLFYRLNVASISLPPLRERAGDIPPLVDFFLQRHGRELDIARPAITARALRYLEEQPWPGNVRQLQNVIRRALLQARGYAIDAPDLQKILRETESPSPSASADSLAGARDGLERLARHTLDRARQGEIAAAYPEMQELMEQALLTEAMRLSGGNQARAAQWLGISRFTLRQKLQKRGIRR